MQNAAQRIPWTRQELQALIPALERKLALAEAEQPEEVRPLPPMTSAECLDLLLRLVGTAATRPLTQRECFLHGQLLAQYQQATFAEAKGCSPLVAKLPLGNLLRAIAPGLLGELWGVNVTAILRRRGKPSGHYDEKQKAVQALLAELVDAELLGLIAEAAAVKDLNTPAHASKAALAGVLQVCGVDKAAIEKAVRAELAAKKKGAGKP